MYVGAPRSKHKDVCSCVGGKSVCDVYRLWDEERPVKDVQHN